MSENEKIEETAPEIVNKKSEKVDKKSDVVEPDKSIKKDEIIPEAKINKPAKKGFFENLEDEWYGDDRGA